jgi:O-acetyl-ADP-ribose deacetylase
MPFQIVRNDITKVKADAIVNTANPRPLCGGTGTDRAIYEAAGFTELLIARQEIGPMARGTVAVTPAFALKAKYIIHAIGPKWIDGESGEFDILTACYQLSLEKALELKCRSIAFPLLATGVYGFPKDRALQIAFHVISAFLMEHEMNVILVVFDQESFELSGKIFDDIASLIDEREVQEKHAEEYYGVRLQSRRAAVFEDECEFSVTYEADLSAPCESAPMASMTCPSEESLEELLRHKEENFQQCLFRMIDERGLKDSEVYTKANMDRKLFSKIRCNPDYHPKKKTVLALAIAMHLDMEETNELLNKAEWALSSASTFDVIVSYFIQRKHYDIFNEINPTLFKYGLPTLGD